MKRSTPKRMSAGTAPRTHHALESRPVPRWHDEHVVLGAWGTHRVRLYDSDGAALALHFHAGAFCSGSLDTGHAVARVLARSGVTVASLDYALAPAHPFPCAVEAGHAALHWLHQRARGAPLFVAGEEAGGNLAAAVAMMSRDRNGPALAGQILLSPLLDACTATGSQRAAGQGRRGCPGVDGWRAYLARDADVLHPYAVPLQSLRHDGLPPTLLITAGDDPTRDETEAYAQRLQGAGVPCECLCLRIATGWPASYLQPPGSPPAAWADAVQVRLHSFLHTLPSRNSQQ